MSNHRPESGDKEDGIVAVLFCWAVIILTALYLVAQVIRWMI